MLALEKSIGNVNTGLANENILGCVQVSMLRSSDQTEYDEEHGRCLVWPVKFSSSALFHVQQFVTPFLEFLFLQF
jgi:hypothetical protein